MGKIFEILQNFRGQATNGTVVTVDHDVMDVVNKKAGKSVYDSDWWVETLEAVLEPTGHRLVRARSGDEALKALLRDEFAAILSRQLASAGSARDSAPTNPSG